MERCWIYFTDERIAVKGDFDYISARLMGNRGGMLELTLVRGFDSKTEEWEMQPVLVNVEFVTFVMAVVSA